MDLSVLQTQHASNAPLEGERIIPRDTIESELRGRGFCKYPFKELEVGESFVCEGAKATRISPSASKYGKRTGKKFWVRTLPSNGGVRVTRIE